MVAKRGTPVENSAPSCAPKGVRLRFGVRTLVTAALAGGALLLVSGISLAHGGMGLMTREQMLDLVKETLIIDMFPQSLYIAVYVFLISLFAANAPGAQMYHKKLITWMTGVAGVIFAFGFLVSTAALPLAGMEGHMAAIKKIFPIPALTVATGFGWTLLFYVFHPLMPVRAQALETTRDGSALGQKAEDRQSALGRRRLGPQQAG